jgi:hypothetical protein
LRLPLKRNQLRMWVSLRERGRKRHKGRQLRVLWRKRTGRGSRIRRSKSKNSKIKRKRNSNSRKRLRMRLNTITICATFPFHIRRNAWLKDGMTSTIQQWPPFCRASFKASSEVAQVKTLISLSIDRRRCVKISLSNHRNPSCLLTGNLLSLRSTNWIMNKESSMLNWKIKLKLFFKTKVCLLLMKALSSLAMWTMPQLMSKVKGFCLT